MPWPFLASNDRFAKFFGAPILSRGAGIEMPTGNPALAHFSWSTGARINPQASRRRESQLIQVMAAGD